MAGVVVGFGLRFRLAGGGTMDPVSRSIDSLQRLYTIVVGLAVTAGLSGYLNPDLVKTPTGTITSTQPRLELLLVLIVTVVPFYHGAIRHLDAAHLFSSKKPPAYTLMVDF